MQDLLEAGDRLGRKGIVSPVNAARPIRVAHVQVTCRVHREDGSGAVRTQLLPVRFVGWDGHCSRVHEGADEFRVSITQQYVRDLVVQ